MTADAADACGQKGRHTDKQNSRLSKLGAAALLALAAMGSWAQTAAPVPAAAATTSTQAPDALVKQISNEVLADVKADKAIQAGDTKRILALVDQKILPHVDFAAMTRSAVGVHWKKATPEQQKRLQEEFKLLLVRTYSKAFTQVGPQTTLEFQPLAASSDPAKATVASTIKGAGAPVKVNYYLSKGSDSWKIVDLEVEAVRMGLSYRSQFSQSINAGGIDGLINQLAEQNKAAAASKG
jgi:phospholipid transport system substrate-binding protein